MCTFRGFKARYVVLFAVFILEICQTCKLFDIARVVEKHAWQAADAPIPLFIYICFSSLRFPWGNIFKI